MATRTTSPTLLALIVLAACAPAPDTGGAAAAGGGPPLQSGADFAIYAPTDHPLYDGHFSISGSRVYQVGSLSDESPWDHMGDDAASVRPVAGAVEIDVDERANTGTFRAELELPEGTYVVELDRFEEFSPCQDGGIAAWLFEHGDSGCGDANWPKSILYVAGWGWGHATLNGETLYTDYQIHFMVTQGMRDRETLEVYPNRTGARGAGAVNPAAMQVDFYIRSPQTNEANHPNRQVFDHFFAMETTWR
ncbi:MAG: hypothetical protein R3E10_12775 [Gemmatimonadota bacterium]